MILAPWSFVMQKPLFAVIAASLVCASVQAAPVTYTLDPNHTQVTATWVHFGLSSPSAHFGLIDGTLVYDADAPEKSSVKVSLPLAGLDGHVQDFNDHLNGKDFFEANKYPKATFVSTRVEKTGEGKLKVTGDLTVKDQTRPVVLDVAVTTVGPHPMSGTQAAGFNATATLKRSDFGVGLYAPNVSDEVKLHITTEALEAKAYAAMKAKKSAAKKS